MDRMHFITAIIFLVLTASCAGAEVAQDDGARETSSDVRFEIFGMD